MKRAVRRLSSFAGPNGLPCAAMKRRQAAGVTMTNEMLQPSKQYPASGEAGSLCGNTMPAGTEMAQSQSADVPAATDEPPHDPCPTPLAWEQVLDAFRSDAELWELRQGGTTIRGRTWGDGPPVYLLPGLGGTHELYALLVWLLREDFRCVVYDDFSLDRGSRQSTATLVDNLFAVADRQGDRQFHLFAPAFASVTAFSAMLAEPNRILTAAIQGGYAHRQLSLTERLLIGVGRRLRRPLASVPFWSTLQTQNHLPWFPPIDRGRWSFFLADTGQLPVSALAERAAVLKEFDVRNRLGEVSQPVLLIRTEGEGQLAAGCQELLDQRIANTQVERLHSSGQLPYLTHPHRLAKLLKTFFPQAATGGL